MFSEQDEPWLAGRYPGLKATADKVEGTIDLKAAFQSDTNRFQIIYPGDSNVVGGCELAGSFKITMQARSSGTMLRVPALTIDGYPNDKDRHIDHDGIACLCSPFVEGEYMSPDLDGRRFMEELVIPFCTASFFTNGMRLGLGSTIRMGSLGSWSPIHQRNPKKNC